MTFSVREFVLAGEAALFAVTALVTAVRLREPRGKNGTSNLSPLAILFLLLGGLFVLFSLFNASFLPKFYRNPTKNGRNFLISAVLCFAWIIVFDGVMIAANAAQEFVPAFSWIETHLDRYPTCVEEWLTQGIFLVVCIGIFAASSEWTFRRSVRAFDGADL